jgi:hypothetical protein
VGSFPKATRQDIFSGLPLLLLSEEVTLLLEKGIAQLIKCTNLDKPPTESLKEKFEEYRNLLFQQQAKCLRENRKRQVFIVYIYLLFIYIFYLSFFRFRLLQ